MSDNAKLLVDERTAAQMLSISQRTLWQLEHDGQIPCIRIGKGTKRYSVDALRAWIAEQEQASGPHVNQDRTRLLAL